MPGHMGAPAVSSFQVQGPQGANVQSALRCYLRTLPYIADGWQYNDLFVHKHTQ